MERRRWPPIPAFPPCRRPDQPLRDFVTRVEADRRITFRLFAPEAKAVSVVFGSMDPAKVKATPMAKDGRGVWSVAIGPVAPDLYEYYFNVDGFRPPTPAATRRSRSARSTAA